MFGNGGEGRRNARLRRLWIQTYIEKIMYKVNKVIKIYYSWSLQYLYYILQVPGYCLLLEIA